MLAEWQSEKFFIHMLSMLLCNRLWDGLVWLTEESFPSFFFFLSAATFFAFKMFIKSWSFKNSSLTFFLRYIVSRPMMKRGQRATRTFICVLNRNNLLWRVILMRLLIIYGLAVKADDLLMFISFNGWRRAVNYSKMGGWRLRCLSAADDAFWCFNVPSSVRCRWWRIAKIVFFGTITIYMNNCRHELWWWPLKLHHLDKFLLLDFWLGRVCLLGHDEGWWKSPELKYYVTSRLYWASYCLFEIFYLPFKNKVEKCQMEPKWFLKILFKPLKLFTILWLAWASYAFDI